MNGCELVAYVTSIACALTKCYSKDELSLLSSILSQLGDTLDTIVTQEELCHPEEQQSCSKST